MAQLRQETEPGEAGLDPGVLSRLDEHLTRLVDTGRLPGYLVSVARHGRVAHLTTYGFRDREARLPVETDTVWRIHSMTKPVVSVAALMLWEEGRLRLTDPLSRHLPAFAAPRVFVSGSGEEMVTRPAAGPLLVRHLLTHTAGLTYGFYESHPVDALYRAAGVESAGPPGADLAESCDVYARLPLQFDPGTQWNYSVATNVLGRLVEVVSGRSLDVFLAERILGPLGMEDTGFQVTAGQAGRLATMYADDGRGGIRPVAGLPVHERPRFLSGGGGLVATAHDYHRFMELLRGRGELDGVRLLRPETVDTMTSNHLPGGTDLYTFGSPVHRLPDNTGVGFGLGVSVVTDPGITRSPTVRGSYGWSGAGSTTFWITPRQDLTVQFLTQLRPNPATSVIEDVRRLAHGAVAADRPH
ncbi:serine hydrolase domain-containing protein [Streptomyces sp. NPDC008313]|uniref:serine hydrolase domain-containing protein n=1 Tax=Streptomyces sp. NPDC008313 TaxID=3364826 RepID=UPI0036E882FC